MPMCDFDRQYLEAHGHERGGECFGCKALQPADPEDTRKEGEF